MPRRSLLIAAFCALAAPARPAVWHVSGRLAPTGGDGRAWATAFTTIQQGLDAAQPGDEVWVAAGFYSERIILSQPNVGLYGGLDGVSESRDRLPSDASSVGRDAAPGPVIWVAGTASGAVVDGFGVSGALNSPGILVEAKDVTLSRNVVHDNVNTSGPEYYDSWGGGISCTGANAVITDNRIYDNRARGGGGLFVWSDNARIERNVIQDNIADNRGLQEPWDGRGGGLLLRGSLMRIRNNVIARNTTVRYATASSKDPLEAAGGGLYGYGVFNLTNNTIADNRAFGTNGAAGGGVYMANGTMVLAGNVLSGNLADATASGGPAHGGGFYSPRDIESPATLEFRANYFSGNAPEDGVPEDTDTRFGSPPQFVSPTDYHLLSTSPLIDYGSNADVEPGERDRDGNPRIMGPSVDVGAYESPVSPAPPTQVRAYVRPDGNDTADGSSWETARRSVGSAISITKERGEIWVAAGSYTERVALKPGLALIGGFAGTETDTAQRDFRAHPTILDGGRAGTVVTIPKEATAASVDGFTIRRGVSSTGFGGGVASSASNVVLANNTVEQNWVYGTGVPQWVTGAGGGAHMAGDALIVANNIFRENRVESIAFGGGAVGAVGEAHGGGLMITAPSALVINNLFTGNEVVGAARDGIGFASGGGLYPNLKGGVIANNTLANNASYGITGGFPYATGDPASPRVTNNIVAFNLGSVLTGRGWAHYDHNLTYGNTGNEPQGESPIGTDGNIAVDPLFVDPTGGNYRLLPVSPAINTGDSNAAFTALDLDGRPRWQGSGVDLGAYEFAPGEPVTVGDASAALRIAAGLSAATPDLLNRLNVADPGAPRIDLADALALLRAATH